MKYKLFIIALSVFCINSASISQKISKKNLPFIDIDALPYSAFDSGKIFVKVKPQYLQSFNLNSQNFFSSLRSFDTLISRHKINKIELTFKNVLKNESKIILHQQYQLNYWLTIYFQTNTDIKKLIKDFKQSFLFDIVEPSYKKSLQFAAKHINFLPNDTRFNEQWNFKNTAQGSGTLGSDIKLEQAWDIETGNPNVVVAVNDMGIDLTHPDLAQNVLDKNKHFNFIRNNDTIIPGYHGTHVAGTIAAVNNNNLGVSGVAGGNGNVNSGIRLMSCQIYEYNNGRWYSNGFAESFVFAADHGAAISQNSWAYDYAGTYELHVLDAIDYFIDNGGGNSMKGGLVVFASGNRDINAIVMPSAYEKVIAVAATNNKDVKTYFSTYGSWVDIAAPGGESRDGIISQILSTTAGGGYAYDIGTSMSCPHVSGVAALIVSKMLGKVSNADVTEILLSTTDNIDSKNLDFKGLIGTGRLNAYKALLKAQQWLNNYTINPVDSFSAENNCNKIILRWKKKVDNNVIILYSNKNNIPQLINGVNYNLSSNLENETKVIYKGSDNSFIHDLNSDEVGFYKIFIFDNNNNYSLSKQASVVNNAKYLLNTTLIQNFDFPILFPNRAWKTINNNNDIGWTHTVLERANTGYNDLYSMCSYNYTYNSNLSSSSILISPVLKYNNNVDKLILNFKLAYQYRQTSYNLSDTFEILATTNCGQSYTSLYKSFGENLSSTGTTNTDTAFYALNTNQWKNINIDLSAFKSDKNLQVAFKSFNGRGNNLFIDNINIEALYKDDISVIDVQLIQENICSNSVSPIIKIKNNTNQLITSFSIGYIINNKIQNLISTNYSINANEIKSITLNNLTLPTGISTIQFYCALNSDKNKLNDTILKEISIKPISDKPINVFEFSTQTFNNFTIYQLPNDDNIFWQLTNKIENKKCLYINNYINYFPQKNKTIDDIILQPYFFNRNYDSVWLGFKHAYSLISLTDSNYFDSLQIDYSLNCGVTWLTAQKMYGKGLLSFNQSKDDYNEFIPNNSQWKKNKILLTTKANQNSLLLVRFRNTSSTGNNLFIDSLEIKAIKTPATLQEQDFVIYPNPVKNQLFIQHNYEPTLLKSINIYNSIGKLISVENSNILSQNDFYLNLINLSSGIYFLKMNYENKSIVKKIIKIN